MSIWRIIHRLSPDRLKRRIERRLKVDDVTVSLPGGEMLRFDRARAAEMFKGLFWYGFAGFEEEAVRTFYELSKKAEVIFDVGAYFGYYALVAKKSNPAALVHAFEPVPASYQLLCHYAELNDCDVVSHNICLGERVGPVDFYLPKVSRSALPNIGSLKNRFQEGATFAGRGFEKLQVQCLPLDSLGIEPDLMKIDTEEAELEVLRGATATIERAKPAILMEIIDGQNAASEMLIAMGYHGTALSSRQVGTGRYGESLFVHPKGRLQL